MPVIERPASSQHETKGKKSDEPVDNATWGMRKGGGRERTFELNNAIWGNRGGKMSTLSAVPDDVRAKVDKFLAKRYADKEDDLVDVIVALDGPTSGAREATLSGIGAKLSKRLRGINALAMTISPRMLDKIAKMKWAKHVSEDVSVVKFDEFTMKSSLADVAFASYGATGKNVAVAVLDSGIKKRPDLYAAGT